MEAQLDKQNQQKQQRPPPQQSNSSAEQEGQQSEQDGQGSADASQDPSDQENSRGNAKMEDPPVSPVCLTLPLSRIVTNLRAKYRCLSIPNRCFCQLLPLIRVDSLDSLTAWGEQHLFSRLRLVYILPTI